jgi:hypothetical protein
MMGACGSCVKCPFGVLQLCSELAFAGLHPVDSDSSLKNAVVVAGLSR